VAGPVALQQLDPDTAQLVLAALAGAEEKIGVDPVVLSLRGLVDSFDALVIVAGRNDRHVRAIAEEIERLVADGGRKPIREEGWDFGEWVALDYGEVVVHIFDEAHREFYDLEHLWNTAPAYRPVVRP
jgi:ribosome-associated protein